jgi:hypothetical protein
MQNKNKKKILKIILEINEKECRKTQENTNETKSSFFENINKMDKSLPELPN